MTFARQLQTARLLLAFFAGLAAASILLSIVNRQWITLAIQLPVMTALGWLIHAQWRALTRQRDLADLAEQLRKVSRDVPAGMDRLYTSVLSTTAVHCHPNAGSGFDQFSRINVDDIESIGRMQAGDIATLPAVTYRVRRSFPVIWRHVWADRAIMNRSEEFTRLPQQTTGYRNVLKLLLLNHRTGVLFPDREELADLLRMVENADHARDIPRATK
jgi:hypothetical protein